MHGQLLLCVSYIIFLRYENIYRTKFRWLKYDLRLYVSHNQPQLMDISESIKYISKLVMIMDDDYGGIYMNANDGCRTLIKNTLHVYLNQIA